ncbi:glycosyltransferase [Eubacteriaceae bacterium ES2]|nr:glycosyltransferase [Eubacteriaceae bacterium ES2]
MIEPYEIWIIIGIMLIILNSTVILRLLNGRKENERNRIIAVNQRFSLLYRANGLETQPIKRIDIKNYFDISNTVRNDQGYRKNIQDSVDINTLEKRALKQLRIRSMSKKAEAALYLGAIGTESARFALEQALAKEENTALKLYYANGLADIQNPASLPVLIHSLTNMSRFYKEKVNMLIADYGEAFHQYLPNIIASRRTEIQELIVDFSSVYFSQELKTYLLDVIDDRYEAIERLEYLYGTGKNKCISCVHGKSELFKDQIICKYHGPVKKDYHCNRFEVLPASVNSQSAHYNLVLRACDILAEFYPAELNQEKYFKIDDAEIKNRVILAVSNYKSPQRFDRLMNFLRDPETAAGAVNALSQAIENNPLYFTRLINIFQMENDPLIKKNLAKILSLRIEYFIMKLQGKNSQSTGEIIKEILLTGRTSESIDFLNKNRDINLENELIAIIRSVIMIRPEIRKPFERYLNDRLLEKCKLTRYKEKAEVVEKNHDTKQRNLLIILLTFSFFALPIAFLVYYWPIIPQLPTYQIFKTFVIDFNYYIAFYAMSVNLIYLFLLIFSYVSVREQERMWNIKDMSLLFKKKMLPSISIVAPAYNEEKTIIESANSLLNLKYPDYELIIVNDGSNDQTLATLIRYFDLRRVDFPFEKRLATKSIRGVYINRSRPNLIVVDKVNGGKADSLNLGINIAGKEYICGIDADSLLEDDALIKLASLTLDKETETPALGGNILPINGCQVVRGQITKKELSDNRLVMFQTVEYLRSFMSGRLGWSYFNCLLIISGAFGLFRKERLINVGGYLTSSGKFKTDTVGEDMELVVRICEEMKRLKHPFQILYAYNANCWTEVPEDIASLKKQRYRWHRGLIEILIFHQKMLFNPRYGRIGMMALPYFFIFEMMGPIFEFQGYCSILIAVFLGIFNAQIAIILFVTMVLMGILVSTASLLIAERNGANFTRKELLKMIAYATIENFGVRQFFSFWRFTGYLNMFKKSAGWQKAERKGFSEKMEKVGT